MTTSKCLPPAESLKTWFDSKICHDTQDPGPPQDQQHCNHIVPTVKVVEISMYLAIRGKKVSWICKL